MTVMEDSRRRTHNSDHVAHFSPSPFSLVRATVSNFTLLVSTRPGRLCCACALVSLCTCAFSAVLIDHVVQVEPRRTRRTGCLSFPLPAILVYP
jgi:hypothetical protein